MGILSACFFVFLIHGALSAPQTNETAPSSSGDDNFLLRPCSKTDLACLDESAKNFLAKTSNGIQRYDFRPIDPWKAELIEIPSEFKTPVNLKNVSVTGLKNLMINSFTLDEIRKKVVLEMRDHAVVDAGVEIVEGDQKYTGSFFGKIVKFVTARYDYELIPNANGQEFFKVGAETLSCKVQGKPQVIVSEIIAMKLWNENNASQVQSKLICALSEQAYTDIIHNLRASAKFFPKTAYFTDM